ncbi:MAG: tubulin-like doman-containing protein [Pseudomonadota bacterium]
MSEFRPTLLVGVGGTGCRIVEQILERVEADGKEYAGKIRPLCFDTDSNDIAKLKRIQPREIVQFSRPETVFRLLDRNPDAERTWFPPRDSNKVSQELLGMSLIDGAAQVRMLTRLALVDSFSHGDIMEKMEGAISSLAVHSQEDEYAGACHILMFGSLAGATGSGSFFQLALALRNAARTRGVNASVRGVFLLPDVFIQGGSLPREQVPNLLANGYASLKELNAINVLVSRPNRTTRFEFSYMPGEAIRTGEMPFEAFTLIDFEASNGGNMGRSLSNYEQMAARAGYLLIFSPLGARYSSITINDVRSKLAASAAGTHNLYSSIGVAAIAYPIESMRTYLTLRLIVENLRGDWTRLDRMFRDRVRAFKRREEEGAGTEAEPDIVQSYVEDLRQLALDENITFFSRIFEQLNPEIDNADTGEIETQSLENVFLDALLEHTRRSFWNSERLTDVAERQSLDISNFKNKSKLSDTVRRTEANLDNDYRLLDTELRSRPESLYRNATLAADDLAEPEWRTHHIQSYLIKGGPHPVQIRAFLYLVRNAIVDRQKALDSQEARQRLFNLSLRYYDDEERQRAKGKSSERGTKRVISLAQDAAKSGFLGGRILSEADQFSDDYVQYYNSSLQQMRAYTNMMVDEKVLSLALEDIDAMIKAYTGLFVEVEDITQTLERELDREEHRYKSGSTVADGSIWVYADPACKRNAWDRLQDMASGLRLDAAVNKTVSNGTYEKFRRDRRERRDTGFRELNRMFMREVVDRFGARAVGEDFAGAFEFSVIEAIRREVIVEETERRRSTDDHGGVYLEEEELDRLVQQFLRRSVDRVSQQSEPYVRLDNPDSDGQPIKFWAIHPKVREDLNNETLFNDTFRFKQGDNPIVEPDFSPYELACVNLRVNLELAHLKKLHHGAGKEASIHATAEGRLFDAYEDLVGKIIAAETDPNRFGGEFTPHIDIRWHRKGFLPEIFVDQEADLTKVLSRAYVVALTHGFLRFEKDYGKQVTHFATTGQSLSDPIDMPVVESHDPWEVFQAFRDATHLINAANEAFDQLKTRGASAFENHMSVGALQDSDRVMRLFALSDKRINVEDRDRETGNNIAAWIGLLGDVIEAQRSDMGATGRALLLRETVDAVRDTLREKISEGIPDPEVRRAYNSALDKAYDTHFTS